MQIKYYTILDTADMSVIQAWTEDPSHRCYVIAQGHVGAVTHSLCVHEPSGMADVFKLTETALEGMIQETEWPE